MDARPESNDLSYFTEEMSAEVVNARIDPEIAGVRLAQVVSALTRHLHAFVKEIEPTHEEWLQGIEFLTRTGQMCTAWRQEFILLSDILGVSSLVDAINSRRPSGATANTILGPFYVMNAPNRKNGDSICLDGKGEPLVVRGRVLASDGSPIAGAIVDVWQANDDGFYDVQQKDVQPDMNMRGTFRSEADGSYWFRSVRPRFYPIPDDGPVGKLLVSLGRHANRAAHIHAIVAADGFDTLITHIFEPNCPYLKEDAVFGLKESLIGEFTKSDDLARAKELGFENAPFFWDVPFDFMLAPSSGRTAFLHQVDTQEVGEDHRISAEL
jgi:hydroxyquinol 1,2-dioxygenase